MKPFDYSTDLMQQVQEDLSSQDIYGKLKLMESLLDCLIEKTAPTPTRINFCTLESIGHLRLNQAFGLIKVLASQCEETVFSK